MEGKAIIPNETGLHARPASLFVNKAKNYKSDIKLILGEKEVNGKSILGVMSLGAKKDAQITIKASGEDDKEAVEGLISFIEEELAD